MPTIPVTTIIQRAQATADMRDNFVTPTQWLVWGTQEKQALDIFLARSGYSLPGLTNLDIVVAGNEAGSYVVSPPSGIMAILCVHEMITNGFRRVRFQDPVAFMKQPPGTAQGAQGHARYFRCISSTTDDSVTLNMYPEPRAGETYRVTYLPHPPTLVTATPGLNQTTTVTYPMGWEERIVLGMARRALMKEESEVTDINKEIELWDRRIEEASWNKVLAENPSVRNSDQETYGWNDRIIWPPYPNSWFWA